MKSLVIMFLVIFGAATEAQAQHVARFDTKTVAKSVQCEIGRFAFDFRRVTLALDRRKVQVSWKGETSIDTSGGVTLNTKIPILSDVFNVLSGFIPKANASTGSKTKTAGTGGRTFNIHRDNRAACSRVNKAPVGVYECLKSNIDLIRAEVPGGPTNPGYMTCSSSATAYGKISANGKVNVWVFEIGPSFDFDARRSFEIDLAVPPKDQ